MTRNVAYLLKGGLAFVASCFFLILLSAALAMHSPALVAHADDEEEKPDYQKTAYELQQEIEARQAELQTAVEEADAAQAAIDETQARIEELEREIPAQQARSSAAVREQYKLQQQSADIVDMLLNSGSFAEFIDSLEYANRASEANVSEVMRLQALKDEVEATQGELRETQQTAEERASDVRTALAAAQEAQAEVQRRIEEEAREQAEIAARAAAMAEQERKNDEADAQAPGQSGPASDGSGQGVDSPSPEGADAQPGEQAESAGEQAEGAGELPDAQAEAQAETVEAPTTVELPADEAAFVNEWAPRIDAYLAGSPLAGQGTTFARAAFAYGVDPRFSPAISYTESGKGQYCFKSHNAWGWGSSSWDSWEEAINDHVAGLARGYGGQISEEAAKKYCPPTWQSWYKRTLEQMNLI